MITKWVYTAWHGVYKLWMCVFFCDFWGMKEGSRDWALWLMAKIRSRLRLFLASLVPGHGTWYRGITATPQRWRTASGRGRWWSGAPISVIVLIIISPLNWRRRWFDQSAAIALILVTVTWHRTVLVASILTRTARTTTHRASRTAARSGAGLGASATAPRCAAWSAQRVASVKSKGKVKSTLVSTI